VAVGLEPFSRAFTDFLHSTKSVRHQSIRIENFSAPEYRQSSREFRRGTRQFHS
jgi:hypothetical protein